MAYTVSGAFSQFYSAINLDGDKRDVANARKDRISGLLSKDFNIVEIFASGSIPRFTALKNHSDVDVIVALHYGKHIEGKKPSEVLQAVRDALSGYATTTRKNGQAVTLHFETWPNVDIVPVSRSVDGDQKVTHYNVPNENTESWIKSKPKTHTSKIEKKSSDCGEYFRQIIKMMKWWNLKHSDYLQSYHIEVLALNVLSGKLDDLPWEIFQFFTDAKPLLEKSLWHDIGYADDYLTSDERKEVLKRIDTAITLSRDAWHFGYSNKDKEAIEAWRQVFGDKFPAYG